jgi:hypothetical protein
MIIIIKEYNDIDEEIIEGGTTNNNIIVVMCVKILRAASYRWRWAAMISSAMIPPSFFSQYTTVYLI